MRNRAIPAMSEADQAFVRALVIHEDASVLAFDKPSGLPVQSRGNKARCLDELLWAFARSNGKRPRLVHRIDAGTSGLVVAAKTQPAAAFLSGAFETRDVAKRYLALVRGWAGQGASGTITAPLVRVEAAARGPTAGSARARVARRAEAGAQDAVTHWTVLGETGQTALVEARPETGRMHQIRAHLAHIGMAILGDAIYGEAETAPRLMLHAAGLDLPHPGGGRLHLSAPLPGDFTAMMAALGLDSVQSS